MKGFVETAGTRRAFSLGEVGLMFGVSRDSVRRAVKRGDLQAIYLGGRVLVPVTEVQRIERDGLPKRKHATATPSMPSTIGKNS